MPSADSLKAFVIGTRTDSAGTAVNPDVDQEEFRMILAAVMRPGITVNLLDGTQNPNAWRVRQNTGGDMNVKVGSGVSKVDGLVLRSSATAGQGTYAGRIDATTVTVSVPATDPTNPARYGVFAFVDDVAYGGTAGRARLGLQCLRGTPAGSPVTPTALAAWSASFLLWEFQLPALAAAVTDAILDQASSIDQRVASSLYAVNPVEVQVFS